ncbi:MYCBP-associated protein isoform X2 [Halichoeres trimaculatus]|uniref:MYCBP-associated protein isoform X2 n=1 Tax=Halichoeres trimaculatus TaxID=147232 RepID=UPI003D9E394F
MASRFRNIQSNALQNWKTQMRQRRQQQNFLADLLDRPVENLLMNQANHFRETQEQREVINQVMPLIHSGYGHHVGSEFWSLPPRYGDEMSGITATLTQTEQGRKAPLTHVGQPSSIQQESGIMGGEILRPASRTWDQSAYLQHRHQELREVLQGLDLQKPDISRLEVVGSCKPFTHVTVCQSPSVKKEEQEKEQKKIKGNLDPLAQYDGVHSEALLVPALKFCGQLARWTGNSEDSQGEVGINATILFEALSGEIASSNLELHNEGSVAIFYSWEKLCVPNSFPTLQQTNRPHFYFNSSSGVILPGDTKGVECFFKSVRPGIKTEVWQLNTHPVLLGGASMQVTLRGVSLYQDKTADQRLFIENKLERIVTVKLCQSIVNEILQGVYTPERPSSPADLYVTEEQKFLSKNPKLQFLDETLEDLKKLWHEVNQGHTWDLSVDTLRQAVLAQPDQDSQEKNLAHLNSLFLQLSEPPVQKHKRLTAAAAGRQLWRKLLDTMDDEARWLRNTLGLTQRGTPSSKQEEALISEADVADKDEISEKKEGAAAREERSGMKSRLKEDNKGESKSAGADKQVEDSKRRGKKRDEMGKRSRGKQEKVAPSLTNTQTENVSQQTPEAEQPDEPEVTEIYTRLLHRKVYAGIEDLVDSLCDLMDELHQGDDH